PLVERDVAALHDGLHGDAEILPALPLGAPEHAWPLGGVGMVHDAAMSTNRAIRPQHGFQELAGRSVIAEVGSRKGIHDRVPIQWPHSYQIGFVVST